MNRPWERRFCASQYPCPSYAKIKIDFALRLRKKNTQPEIGSSPSWAWQTRTNESIRLRPSTGSIASTRICAVTWIIVLLPARREEGLPSQELPNPSTECASCRQQETRTRSRTPAPSSDVQRSARQTPVRLPSSALSQLHPVASSTAHSPTAAGELPNTNRVAAPVPPQTAIATPAAWSEADGYLETAPVRVEVEQLVRESTMSSCASISAVLAG